MRPFIILKLMRMYRSAILHQSLMSLVTFMPVIGSEKGGSTIESNVAVNQANLFILNCLKPRVIGIDVFRKTLL